MDPENLHFHLDAYRKNGQTQEAAAYLMRAYALEDMYFGGFEIKPNDRPGLLVVTTTGEFGGLQKINIPENIFNVNIPLILNLLAHEMLHVRQKTRPPFVEDKNEREWQAYYEMLFHNIFPQIPDAPDFSRKGFAENALMYYNRMGDGSELQRKYALQKQEVEELLTRLSEENG